VDNYKKKTIWLWITILPSFFLQALDSDTPPAFDEGSTSRFHLCSLLAVA
jgi:hypothetical protein